MANKTSFKAGSVPWNKGLVGTFSHSEEWKKKMRMIMKSKGLDGANSPSWKGGKNKCKICGKLLSNYRSTYCRNHVVHTSERNMKISISKIGKKRPDMSGENHPLWIKDRTLVKTTDREHNDPRYKQWKKEVHTRDRSRCRIANEDCSGRLEAHHILPWSQSPELRYEMNNGITLCRYHHPRKREEERRLAPAFQEMVLRPVYEQAHN